MEKNYRITKKPQKLTVGDKIQNNFGYLETIYFIEQGRPGEKYLYTSHFDRLDRNSEIHKTYRLSGENLSIVYKKSKSLKEVLCDIPKECSARFIQKKEKVDAKIQLN